MWRLIVVLMFAAGSAFAQTAADPFGPIRGMVGKWEGASTGEPGKGVSTREYHFDLDGKFLFARNRSVWEPKSAGAKGEVHEDFGVYSYDRSLKKIVLRQFHSEGFVNEYTLESSGPVLEFVSTRIENIAPGWRAKEAWRIVSADEVVETFSLAAPGKDFAVYSETRLKRVK